MRAKLVNENIDFKRGKTPEEVKSILFNGPPFQPGDIVWDQMERGQGKVYLYLGDNQFLGFGLVYEDIHQSNKPIRLSPYSNPWIDEFTQWEQDRIRNMRILPPKFQREIKDLVDKDSRYRGRIYRKMEPNWRLDESISFERGKSPREIKTSLFGYRLGQLVTPKEEKSEITKSIGVIVELYGKKEDQSAQLVSLGYIFTTPDKPPYFEGMSGYAGTNAKAENFRPLNDREMRLVSSYLKDPKNSAWLRAKKRDIKMKSRDDELIPILFETANFERGKSEREIKKELRGGGFLPGEIIIKEAEGFGRLDRQIIIFLGRFEDHLMPIKMYPFGVMRKRGGVEKADLIHDTSKGSGIYYTREDHIREVTPEEKELIQQALDSGKYDRYIETAKEKTGLTPFV